MTLSDACTAYLDWLRGVRNYSPSTCRSYRATLMAFSANCGDIPAEELAKNHIRTFQTWLNSRGNRSTTRALALTALRGFLRWACREDVVDHDISIYIDMPRRGAERLPKPMSPADLRATLCFLAGASRPRDLRDQALILFLLSTGCRISEALALDRKIAQSLTVLGKGGRERIVFLTDEALAALHLYLAQRTDGMPALFISYDRSGSPGSRLTPVGARSIVTRIRRESGAASFVSPHVTRHTAATMMLEAVDGDLRVVQELLGHVSVVSTQGYTRVANRAKAEAHRRYADRLFAQRRADSSLHEEPIG